MRTSTLLGVCALASLSLSTMTLGCDEVAKAVDANNTQAGEADGRAVELASIPQRLGDMAVDGTEIWIVAENGDVLKRPRSGANIAPTKVSSFARQNPYGETSRALLDAEFAYVLDGRSVNRIPRAGGSLEKLADAAAANLAVTTDAIFAVSMDNTKVIKIDKKTKAVTDLATGFGHIEDMAAVGERLVVADREGETITAIAMADGAKTDLAKSQSRPYRIGLGPDHVYWINGALSDTNKAVEEKMFRIKKDGTGQPEVVVDKVDGFPRHISADAQFLYIDQACGGVYRAPVAGGETTKFLNAAVQDFDLAESGLTVLEDNGCRFDDTARNQPNRLLSVTK